jgi:hypothetical protein
MTKKKKFYDIDIRLNDRIIGFYFEYLHLNKFDSANGVCFISPEVSQFLKLAQFEEIPIFLEPLELERKEVILLAVNNAKDPSGKTYCPGKVGSIHVCISSG